MPYSLITTDKQDYLLFITNGSIQSADEFWDFLKDVATQGIEKKYNRLLFDHRTLYLQITQYDALMCVEKLLNVGIPIQGFRTAMITSKNSLEVGKFVETALTNRSVTYKRFETRKDALDWLLV